MTTETVAQPGNSGLENWEDRWQSLNNILGDLPNSSGWTDLIRKNTVQCLVSCLQRFAERQFMHFYRGFGGVVDQDRSLVVSQDRSLEESAEFPDEFVLQAVLAQVAYDLEAILRATHQRISGSEAMKDALPTADVLAWKALKLAKRRGLISEKTTALTYFQKSPNIRIIPYAPVALIGVPFTAIPNGQSSPTVQDYLAIAHEVGHYVYRRGRTRDSKESIYRYLAKTIPGSPTQGSVAEEVRNWREEIFADVYGCLVAGPAIVLSAQELASQASAKDFVVGDKKHPKPMVRPEIYTALLDASYEKLSSRWGSVRDERRKQQASLPDYQVPEDADLEATQREVKKVIGYVRLLLPSSPGKQWVDDTDADVETYYAGFQDFIDDPTNGVADEDLELEPCPEGDIWEQWKEYEGFPEPEVSTASLTCAGSEEDLREEADPNGRWIQIALAAGWTTKIHNHGNP